MAPWPGENSKIEEQVASRRTKGLPHFVGLAEAIDLLYWDLTLKKVKRGAKSEDQGGIVRLVQIVRQLDVTFDIQALSGQQIIALLPRPEFDPFLPAETESGGIDVRIIARSA